MAHGKKYEFVLIGLFNWYISLWQRFTEIMNRTKPHVAVRGCRMRGMLSATVWPGSISSHQGYDSGDNHVHLISWPLLCSRSRPCPVSLPFPPVSAVGARRGERSRRSVRLPKESWMPISLGKSGFLKSRLVSYS